MENTRTKNSRKAILFILISLLCGVSVTGLYLPLSPWLDATHLWFFEFPPFSLSVLSTMVGILLTGILFGRMARKYSSQVESKFQIRFATISIFFNAIIMVLPVLNLIAMFTPRTITGVVNYKTEGGGYICVAEIKEGNSWSQKVNFDDNTIVYEQREKVDQHRNIISIDTIQPGQVVEIGYIDNDSSIFRGIKSLSITVLEGQSNPYKDQSKDQNCGNYLE